MINRGNKNKYLDLSKMEGFETLLNREGYKINRRFLTRDEAKEYFVDLIATILHIEKEKGELDEKLIQAIQLIEMAWQDIEDQEIEESKSINLQRYGSRETVRDS